MCIRDRALQRIDRLRDHCVVLLAQSDSVDRRAFDRLPLTLRGRLVIEEEVINFNSVDISEELVLLKPEKPISLRPAQRLTIQFEEGIGVLMARHIETTALGLSIQLDASETDVKKRLRSRLLRGSEELAARRATLIEAVQITAQRIEDCLLYTSRCV